MVKCYISIPSEGIEYDYEGRLKYNQEFHTEQGRQFTTMEIAYLCKFADKDELKSLSMALGRTEQVLRNTLMQIKKNNLLDHFVQTWDRAYERYEVERANTNERKRSSL